MAGSDPMDSRVTALETTVARHGNLIERLNEDIQEIRILLGSVATKDQVAELKDTITQHFLQSFNSALNAAPQWVAIAIGTLGFIAAIGAAIAAFLALHH